MHQARSGSRREQRAAEMRRIVDGFAASGLSLAAYCRTRSVSVSTFHYWRRRRPAPFVEFEVVAAGAGGEITASFAGAGGRGAAGAHAASAVEVAGPNGAVIRLPRDADEDLLRRALRAVASC